jgi:predicted NBD/HSP70 family sugar kinase
MAARKKTSLRTQRRILVVDVGGTHVKFRIGGKGAIGEFASGPKMRPARMVGEIRKRLGGAHFDAVAMGYPGLVFHGRIVSEPHNLGPGWVDYDFRAAFAKPVRLVNDAAMQAIGSYEGGRMLFLGLGTGLGVALILDGDVESTEVAHLPYKRGRSYEDYVGEHAREQRGGHKWRKAVRDVIKRLASAFEVDYVVLGGGNAVRLKKLPPSVRLGDNHNALRGGLRLWEPGADPRGLHIRATRRRPRG